MKIVTIVGARPQFIKAAPVSRAFSAKGVNELLIHTGQHYDEGMSAIFFKELNIPEPYINLGIGSLPPAQQVGKTLIAIQRVLETEKPDHVLVYGDTNSTLAGALGANKVGIPLAHVEAGLRSFNRAMPEESNRLITDHLSDLLFTPTNAASENLKQEYIDVKCIQQVGDVMFDAIRYYSARSSPPANFKFNPGEYVLATIHRAENTDDPHKMIEIWQALDRIAKKTPVVLPLHPRTKAALGSALNTTNVTVLSAVSYLEMIWLEKNATLIVTDSGGVQKEAFFQGIPCVTLREETEWSELVENKWNRLVPPTGSLEIVRGVLEALSSDLPQEETRGLFGDGQAAEKIVDVLVNAS